MSSPYLEPAGPLGDTETRLRGLLEQEGRIPLDLQHNIVPVAIVGDGTWPGFGGAIRGRRFSFPLNIGTGFMQVVAATLPVVISYVGLMNNAAVGTPRIRFYGPNDADPAGGVYPFIPPLQELSRVSTEVAPLLRSNSIAPAGGVISYEMVNAVAGFFDRIKLDLYLPINGRIAFESAGVGANISVHVQGYVW